MVKNSTEPGAVKELIPSGKHLVVFDGVCNFCNWSVNFIMKRDPKKRFMFAPYQDASAQKLLAAFDLDGIPPSSTFLIEGTRLYDRSTAALRIAKRLRFPWPMFWAFMLVPKFIRDWIYGVIGKNRYRWWGKRDECRVPAAEEKELFLV